ncbi:MAG: threonylcarbamoyl-AMP synthase [Deltaproteobacteria bacterium]|nr:threonylcarbamoyl-AMP synthase [Deltaproteobacteria bacterium]
MAKEGAQLLVIDQAYSSPRKIAQAAQVLDRGGVIAYPTDTVYGIGCDLHNRKAIDRIYRIKGLDRGHRLSFICEDLSNITDYAQVTDFAYRWLKRLLPGPYTVILPASRGVPKILLEKRREVGIRVPDNTTCMELTRALGRPIISTSATDPTTGDILIDPDVVKERLGKQLDLILDGGLLTNEPSTVVSLMDDDIEVLREGKGPIDLLLGD